MITEEMRRKVTAALAHWMTDLASDERNQRVLDVCRWLHHGEGLSFDEINEILAGALRKAYVATGLMDPDEVTAHAQSCAMLALTADSREDSIELQRRFLERIGKGLGRRGYTIDAAMDALTRIRDETVQIAARAAPAGTA